MSALYEERRRAYNRIVYRLKKKKNPAEAGFFQSNQT